MPEDLERSACVPAVEAVIVTKLPAVPVTLNVPLMVVALPAPDVKVRDVGLLDTVKLLRVKPFAPKIIAPVPPPVMVRLFNVIEPPWAIVFEDADVSVTAIVEVPALKVRFVIVLNCQTVPVPVRVHVPEPIVIDRVVLLLEFTADTVTLWPFASKVPIEVEEIFVLSVNDVALVLT